MKKNRIQKIEYIVNNPLMKIGSPPASIAPLSASSTFRDEKLKYSNNRKMMRQSYDERFNNNINQRSKENFMMQERKDFVYNGSDEMTKLKAQDILAVTNKKRQTAMNFHQNSSEDMRADISKLQSKLNATSTNEIKMPSPLRA